MSKFESESKKNIRSLLQQEDADDYELENPREKVDFSYFGDQPSYLESKRLPPIKIYIYGNYSHFEKATAYFMLRKAGVEFSDDYREKYYDIGWFWDSRITVDKTTKKCRQQSREVRFINYFLIDTSKDFVAKSIESHFGYTFKIDPRSFNGYCIAKHNGNGTKSCFFLKCPIDADEVFHDHCYQKIINYSSETDRSTLYEVRVPIFKNIIPFTFFKTRNKGLRFTSKNRSMQIVPANAHLSNEELESIIEYCRSIGLEYGELDILRCDDTKQIYIIDVNNTAWWPPNKLGDIDRNIALNMMWNAWLEAFLPDKFDLYHIPDDYLDDFVNSKNPNKNLREKSLVNYSGYKYVGKYYELPYNDLWKEIHKKFLSQSYVKPKPPPPPPEPKKDKKKWGKKGDNKQSNNQEKKGDNKQSNNQEKKGDNKQSNNQEKKGDNKQSNNQEKKGDNKQSNNQEKKGDNKQKKNKQEKKPNKKNENNKEDGITNLSSNLSSYFKW